MSESEPASDKAAIVWKTASAVEFHATHMFKLSYFTSHTLLQIELNMRLNNVQIMWQREGWSEEGAIHVWPPMNKMGAAHAL